MKYHRSLRIRFSEATRDMQFFNFKLNPVTQDFEKKQIDYFMIEAYELRTLGIVILDLPNVASQRLIEKLETTYGVEVLESKHFYSRYTRRNMHLFHLRIIEEEDFLV